ncbi:hypothetical protein [Pseudomonas sp. MIACH]|uniref:hypothetical protein n=1 Tax=Pseudomonas sp. MIACH TaxID=1078355 RepID=UPI00069CF9BE|nr:hypothetical protein [Pseudomonas sp. MIACH]
MTTLTNQQAVGKKKSGKTAAQKQKAALASRAAARKYRAERGAGILVLDAPEFDTLNANGLISYDNSRKPLPITIDVSGLGLNPAEDFVDVHMRGRGVTGWGARLYRITFNRPGDPSPDDPIVRDLPVSRLTPGEHEVGYIVWEGESTPTESDPALLEVDHEPPYGREYPLAPVLPDFVISAGEINQQVIDANPDGLVCTYPDYPAKGRKPDDSIAVYFGRYSSSQLYAEPIDTFPVTDALSFTLEWDQLDFSKGGDYYLFCVYTDLAENSSRDSTPAHVSVKVVADPVPLAAEVDLAPQPADGLIDLTDAQNPDGVHAIIRKYDNDLPTDVIELQYGSQPAMRFDVSLYLPFPLLLPIPTEAIFNEYAGSTGEQPTVINYVVDRNGAETNAPEASFLVDLSAPGPDPSEEEENDLLNLVTVVGVTDPDEENVLLPGDFGEDATLTIVLWDVPLPAPGITITPYWGDLAHPLEAKTLSTEGPGATLTFDVEWEDIRDVNNGLISVFYTLSWETNGNVQKSPSRLVDVRANKVILEAPTFRKATTPMACTDLELVTREAVIRIPGNTVYFREFERIRVEWQIFSNAAGTTPLGDPFEFISDPLTPDMVANGFNMKIGPYATVVRPCGRNSVDIHYFVDVPGEGPVKSQRGFTTTRFANLGGQFCEDMPVLEDPDD